MRIDVTKCDACPCSSPADEARATGWMTFSGCFVLPNGNIAPCSLRADLCPACVTRVSAMMQLAINQVATETDARLESIETVEQRHILNVLNAVGWVKIRAARILGIERSTLDRKINLYGLNPPSPTTLAGPVPELATA